MMEGRLITGDQREFVIEAWDGVNRSGWQPLDDKVLILMEEHAETTSGGIYVTPTIRDRQSMAGETGLVIALGPAAYLWNDDLTRKWEGRKPEPGDRVYVERYAGALIQGHDGRAYRLMSQRCVGALALPLPEVVMPEAVGPVPSDDPVDRVDRVFPLPPLRELIGPAPKPKTRRRKAA